MVPASPGPGLAARRERLERLELRGLRARQPGA